MATTSVNALMYDLILSIPGMGEMIKIDFRVSRKIALLLNNVIERGLSAKGDEKSEGLLANMPQESLDELRAISNECLEKAGLKDLSEKLKSFG